MAYEGIEVEIKLSVSELAANAIRSRLISGGAAEKHQLDRYFDNSHASFLTASPIREWLSIRQRGDRTLINHKLFYFGANGHATHCDEVDLDVESAKGAQQLLSALGFEPLITVDKRRVESVIDERYLVAIDNVEGLGHFVEIEATYNAGSVIDTLQALERFAVHDLGLSLDALDHKGYPHLLLEQRSRARPA